MKKFSLGSFSLVPVFGLLAAGGFWFLRPSAKLLNAMSSNLKAASVEKRMLFGMDVTDKDVTWTKVKPGQTFSELISGFGVEAKAVQQLLDTPAEGFHPGKLTAGKKFWVIRSCENPNATPALVYEESSTVFYTFTFDKEPRIVRGEKAVTTERKNASGVIDGSLWKAFESQDLPTELVMRISEIYAWEIDFFRLIKGDKFAIDYDERSVEGKSVGVGDIHAIRFVHNNKDYYGFWFEQDGKGDFYDEEGNSLRKAFLRAPLKFTRISSGYTMKRFHPILKRYTSHPGIDYAAPMGTPILAVGDGVILEAQFKGGNGNYVKIRHNQTYSTQYLHMSKFGPGIKAGAHVSQGQVIGYVGSTGLSTGPHLCYRFWKNGVQVNPLAEDFPTSEPIHKENRDAFDKVKAAGMEALRIRDEKEAEAPLRSAH